jgi:hypothetical protein
VKIYEYIPHPRHEQRKAEGPVKTSEVAGPQKDDRWYNKANAWVAVKISKGVGTMWCAYAFAAISLYGLPTALKPGGEGIVSWIAQTFLQLVLLSIIMVGQDVMGKASDARAAATYKDAEAMLSEAMNIQKHLEAQDEILTKVAERNGIS